MAVATAAGESSHHNLPPEVTLDEKVPAVLTLIQAREARLWATKLLGLFLQAFPASDALAEGVRVMLSCLAPVVEKN